MPQSTPEICSTYKSFYHNGKVYKIYTTPSEIALLKAVPPPTHILFVCTCYNQECKSEHKRFGSHCPVMISKYLLEGAGGAVGWAMGPEGNNI